MQRRTFTTRLAALALAPVAAPSFAAPLSSRPIRLVLPFGAGGVADLTARSVAQQMAATLGQPIVVDNKPSAGGVVASEQVAKAAPDGHTLLLMSNATAVSEGLFKSLPFDTERDFAPVALLGTFDLGLLVAGNSKYRTLADLLADARARPGKLNIGTIAVGSTQNLAAELFKTTLGIDAAVVPFNGTPAVVTALRGGQLDAAVEILPPVLAQVTAGALRVLASMGAQRALGLANVPTVAEAGGAQAKGFDVASWNALAAPARTPAAIVARLNQEANAALATPDVKKRLQDLGVTPRGGTPQQLAALLHGEILRWRGVIERAGIPRQ